MSEPVLEVEGLTKIHGPGCDACLAETGAGSRTNLCRRCRSVVAVHGVSFDLHEGEILGIMGESGSGKSSIIRLLHGDEPPTSGVARLHDEGKVHRLFELNRAEQRWLRDCRLGIVYQNPHLGLRLDVSAGGNIAERLLVSDEHEYGAIRARARALLDRTSVPVERIDEPPRRFSGGMQQRVQIARALATQPRVLLLDEVTSGLDLSVQAKILDLILELQEQTKAAMLVVTHDLGVVRLLATRTLVVRFGEIVESGLTDQLLEDPQHPYTQELVSSAL